MGLSSSASCDQRFPILRRVGAVLRVLSNAAMGSPAERLDRTGTSQGPIGCGSSDARGIRCDRFILSIPWNDRMGAPLESENHIMSVILYRGRDAPRRIGGARQWHRAFPLAFVAWVLADNPFCGYGHAFWRCSSKVVANACNPDPSHIARK